MERRFEIKTYVLGPFSVNCYLVLELDAQKILCIDPGVFDGEMWNFISNSGFELTHIFITHAHVDHLSGVAELRRRSGAVSVLHSRDLFLLPRTAQVGPMYGYNDVEVPDIDVILEGEEGTLDTGWCSVKWINTPGHSPGSITLDVAGSLFTGDLLFAGSVGRTDFPGGDHFELMSSIRDKIWKYPDTTPLYPGHGRPTSVGVEKRENPFVGDLK